MAKKFFKFARIPWIEKIGKQFEALPGMWDNQALVLKLLFGAFALFLGLFFNQAFQEYTDESQRLAVVSAEGQLGESPSILPVASKGLGAGMALVGFFISLWIRNRQEKENRHRLILASLWVTAFGCLLSWLPTDVVATVGAMEGKAPVGEVPSIAAYIGKMLLISILILSPPIALQFFFRLDIMDQYVVKGFLTPFIFCLLAFTSIWLIFDFTDNGPAFSGLPPTRLVEFYLVQIPFLILFVLPIVILLSLLYALSKMSKSNELISMIGSGRSVIRILSPLLIIGAYCSLIALALKYEWGPTSAGRKEAILQKALRDQTAKRTGQEAPPQGLWAKQGWMHINDYGARTWYVGLVPSDLSKPVRNVVIWKMDEKGQPVTVWQAREASWNWRTEDWLLTDGKILRYHDDRVPRIEVFDQRVISGWNETPWKVLSSSQNPEFLGMPGLMMYLSANREMADQDLASFRTNRWNIFAEPALCFAMVLVAAPLGIVYSRKGVLGGVTAAVAIFAVMYVMKGTTMALGQGNRIPPFFGAWTGNLIVAGIGVVLLWFRSANREIPKMKTVIQSILNTKKT